MRCAINVIAEDDAVREEEPVPLYVTQSVTRRERDAKFAYLDWEGAKRRECDVLLTFNVVGDAVETELAKRNPNAVFSLVHAVNAVKGADLPAEDQEARVRAVYGGNRVWDSRGEAAIFS